MYIYIYVYMAVEHWTNYIDGLHGYQHPFSVGISPATIDYKRITHQVILILVGGFNPSETYESQLGVLMSIILNIWKVIKSPPTSYTVNYMAQFSVGEVVFQ